MAQPKPASTGDKAFGTQLEKESPHLYMQMGRFVNLRR